MIRAACLCVGTIMAHPVVAQDHLLTCGLQDCSVLGDPLAGLDQATIDRLKAIATRVDAMSETDLVELVALSIGQVGCYEGWPAEGMFIEPYYEAAMTKVARNLRMTPDEAAFFESELWTIFYHGIDELDAQGRLVSVTEYADELIPAACATGQ